MEKNFHCISRTCPLMLKCNNNVATHHRSIFRCIYKSFTVVAIKLATVIDLLVRHKLSAWVIDCSCHGQLVAHCKLLACIKWAKNHKVCSIAHKVCSIAHKVCTIVLWANKAHLCTLWKIKYAFPFDLTHAKYFNKSYNNVGKVSNSLSKINGILE